MNTIDYLTHLASTLPCGELQESSETKISSALRDALITNDSKALRSLISDKEIYAHEVRVTVY